MKRIAKFHKVSAERFTADWNDTFAQSQEEAEKYTKLSASEESNSRKCRI